jgi:CRISPR-associated protein Cas2
MLFVVCYDIADDRRRRKVEKALKNFGRRVQESVFEADLNEDRYLKMQAAVGKVMDRTEDTVRYYRQCHACKLCVEVQGTGSVPTDGPELLVV